MLPFVFYVDFDSKPKADFGGSPNKNPSADTTETFQIYYDIHSSSCGISFFPGKKFSGPDSNFPENARKSHIFEERHFKNSEKNVLRC